METQQVDNNWSDLQDTITPYNRRSNKLKVACVVFRENGGDGRDTFLIRSLAGRQCTDKKEDWFTKYDKVTRQLCRWRIERTAAGKLYVCFIIWILLQVGLGSVRIKIQRITEKLLANICFVYFDFVMLVTNMRVWLPILVKI